VIRVQESQIPNPAGVMAHQYKIDQPYGAKKQINTVEAIKHELETFP